MSKMNVDTKESRDLIAKIFINCHKKRVKLIDEEDLEKIQIHCYEIIDEEVKNYEEAIAVIKEFLPFFLSAVGDNIYTRPDVNESNLEETVKLLFEV